MYNLNDIKSWFKTGKFPTEDQFAKTWDSFWHKAEKISMSAIENLQNILSAKADRDMVDSQVNDLRANKENVGVARELIDIHNVASDAHQALFDLKANEADVYHRDFLDARYETHIGDAELHFTEEEKTKLHNVSKFVTEVGITPAQNTDKLNLLIHSIDPQTEPEEVAEIVNTSIEMPLATDSHNGLMSPIQKSVVDHLFVDNANLTASGTPSFSWQLSATSGPKIKNSGGQFELRNADDTAYTDLTLNNLTIKGNVVQDGGSFITNAETVETKDNLILINKGEVGAGVTKGIAGLEIDRGTADNYKIVFDEFDDRFKAGAGEDIWPILLRDKETDLIDGNVLVWDAAVKRAKTKSSLKDLAFKDSVNLALSSTTTTIGITNDCGNGVVIPAASPSQAGTMTAADRDKMTQLFDGSMLDSQSQAGYHRHNYLEMADLPPVVELSASSYAEFKSVVEKLQVEVAKQKFGRIIQTGNFDVSDETVHNLQNIDFVRFSGNIQVDNFPLHLSGYCTLKSAMFTCDSRRGTQAENRKAIVFHVSSYQKLILDMVDFRGCFATSGTPSIPVIEVINNGNEGYIEISKAMFHNNFGQGIAPTGLVIQSASTKRLTLVLQQCMSIQDYNGQSSNVTVHTGYSNFFNDLFVTDGSYVTNGNPKNMFLTFNKTGLAGIVPAPSAGQANSRNVLCGDGVWREISSGLSLD